jgi:hypothetical protein
MHCDAIGHGRGGWVIQPNGIASQSADELAALVACFEVGGEDNPNVSEGQWESVLALIEQAARTQDWQSGQRGRFRLIKRGPYLREQ